MSRSRHLNWANVLTIACRQKRPYDLPELFDTLLRRVGELFPGSHGLLYEHDDDLVDDEDGNRYQVKVLIRGVVTIRPDPFFSRLNANHRGLTDGPPDEARLGSKTGATASWLAVRPVRRNQLSISASLSAKWIVASPPNPST